MVWLSRGLIIRLSICLVLLGGTYTCLVAIPRIQTHKKQQIKDKALVEFWTAVDQNYLAYQELANPKNKDATSSVSLPAIRENLTASQKSFQHSLSNPPKKISADIIRELKQADRLQTRLLKLYDGRYNALIKPLQYIPADDLSLKTESIARAKSASSALSGFATSQTLRLVTLADQATSSPSIPIVQDGNATFRLTEGTRKELQQSAKCFATLANQLQHKDKSASKTLQKCTRLYEDTREEIVNVITQPLRDSDGKKLQTTLLENLKLLQVQINKS